MRHGAQASLEFVFMLSGGILVVLFVIRKFITARASTVKIEGERMNATINKTADTLKSMMSTP